MPLGWPPTSYLLLAAVTGGSWMWPASPEACIWASVTLGMAYPSLMRAMESRRTAPGSRVGSFEDGWGRYAIFVAVGVGMHWLVLFGLQNGAGLVGRTLGQTLASTLSMWGFSFFSRGLTNRPTSGRKRWRQRVPMGLNGRDLAGRQRMSARLCSEHGSCLSFGCFPCKSPRTIGGTTAPSASPRNRKCCTPCTRTVSRPPWRPAGHQFAQLRLMVVPRHIAWHRLGRLGPGSTARHWNSTHSKRALLLAIQGLTPASSVERRGIRGPVLRVVAVIPDYPSAPSPCAKT